ncbi:MAG: FHA domain-containing protein [Lachnospiraceae bacterium]|nr:FHA domain-containing protein [Lachnospiraceae bacterium]
MSNELNVAQIVTRNQFTMDSVVRVRVSDLMQQLSKLTRKNREDSNTATMIRNILRDAAEKNEDAAEINMPVQDLVRLYDQNSENDLGEIDFILCRNNLEEGRTARIDIFAKDRKGMCVVFGDQAYPLRKGTEYRVGREVYNSIIIDYDLISRNHCKITCGKDGVVMISDLDSTNGTFVNNVRLEKTHPESWQKTISSG